MANPQHLAYELSDPRESDIPRYVACGLWPRPWRHLWDFRAHLPGRLGGWLRDLDGAGLQPVLTWGIGRGCRLPFRLIRHHARYRLIQICQWSGRTFPDYPSFLLNTPPATDRSPRPVVRLAPDGTSTGFPSVRSAARTVGYSRPMLDRWIAGGNLDPDGQLWAYSPWEALQQNRHDSGRTAA